MRLSDEIAAYIYGILEQAEDGSAELQRNELAEKLGADIVAEGIETPEQLAFLKTVGCRLVQGYIFSKPLPLPEFEERWISRDEK